MTSERTYDFVILGATGYTGKCAVEHAYASLPTNIKWAVAGRSQTKLGNLIGQMQKNHPNRKHPGLEIVELNKEDLDGLAKKTRAIINGVGPYHIYSTPVVEACAVNGTHYFDVTGETTWYYDLLQKYEQIAKDNGAIIVPEIGLESFPTDILTYLAAKRLREVYNVNIEHCTTCVYRLKSGGISHGTLLTGLTVTRDYPISHIYKTMQPYSLASNTTTTTTTTKTPSRRPLLSQFLGPFTLPPFGLVTTSPTSTPNLCISHRSSSLLSPELYSPSFRLEEYIRVPNRLIGLLAHTGLATISILMLLPPVRWVLHKLLITAPGIGPSEDANRDSFLDMRGLGVGSISSSNSNSNSNSSARARPSTNLESPSPTKNKEREENKVVSRLTYNSHMYKMSGVLMVECAMSVLSDGGDEKVRQKKFDGRNGKEEGQGGILTGACLAECTDLLERLEKVGFTFEVEDYD